MVRSSTTELIPRDDGDFDGCHGISKTAREQVNRLGELLKELSEQAKAQVARIDGAVERPWEAFSMPGNR